MLILNRSLKPDYDFVHPPHPPRNYLPAGFIELFFCNSARPLLPRRMAFRFTGVPASFIFAIDFISPAIHIALTEGFHFSHFRPPFPTIIDPSPRPWLLAFWVL